MKKLKVVPLQFLFICLFSTIVQFSALSQDFESEMSNPGYQSYLAHIAAANASFRLNEPVEATRWLESAPAQRRGWEYRYLSSLSDKSLSVFDSLSSRPMSQDYSSDGSLLAIACEDSTVRVYDIKSGKVKFELTGHRGAVYSAQFFPDSEKILTCSRDSILRIWSINGELLKETNAGGQGLQYADLSPAGDRIAYASWKRTDSGVTGIVSLWDANTLEKVWETDFDVKPIVKVKFSPDGSRFAIGTWNWKVVVWNTKELGTPKIFDFDDVPTYSAIDDIAFSPDGKRIAAATKNGSPRVWDIETGRKILELHGHDKPVMSIGFSPDGNFIYTGGSDATVAIWDANTGIRIGRLFGHSNSVNSIEFRPVTKVSGASLAPAAQTFSTISSDNTIRIWDSNTDLEFQNPAGRASHSYGFALSNDGKHLATGGKDGSVSIWNAESGELINNYPALPTLVNAADFSPDGKQIVVCSWDSTVKVLDALSGQEIYVKQEMRHGAPSCAFSPDGRFFAAGSSDNAGYIWKAEDGKLLMVLNHPGGVSYVAFSPDGNYFLTAAGNGLVTVWSTATWEREAAVEEDGVVHCIEFSPDSTSFITVGRTSRPKIWDIATGELLMQLEARDNTIWSVAQSTNTNRIATGSADNTIRLWDAASGVCTLILSDLSDPVYNLAFSPDGSRLYANASGTQMKIFDSIPVRERIDSLKASASK